MTSSTTYIRTTMQPRISSVMKQRTSGYEPSDTETEWQESPWNETDENNERLNPTGLNVIHGQGRKKIEFNRRNSGKIEFEEGFIPARTSMTSPAKRRQSKSQYVPQTDDGHVHHTHRTLSTKPVSPFSRSEQRRYISPHKTEMEDGFNRKLRQANNDVNVNRRRPVSAPRQRIMERDLIKNESYWEQNKPEKKVSPLRRNSSRKERDGYQKKSPSGGEINEMLANEKIAKAPIHRAPNFESTDTIAPGDIFFSTDYGAFKNHNNVFTANGGTETKFIKKSEFVGKTNPGSHQRNQLNSLFNQDIREVSATVSTVSTQTNDMHSKFSVSRQSSNLSDFSGRTNGTARKFTANRQKSQTDAWFSCIKRGSCRRTKSPEKARASYEASVIEKAFVVESLRQFWADKHRPGSLSGFTCHKQEALLLKHLASYEIPHILLKGPHGSGKKSLTMALLREIYGDPVRNISHDLRYFHIQETRTLEVVVPISSSPHHVELNVSSEPNAMYALTALVKQISTDYAVIREISTVNIKADYKVMILYDVDKAPDKIQHLIKWIMDCYSDACKLILCCEDDADILESVKRRCKVIDVEAPDIHEIREVLIQIARKEDLELSMSFADRVANKSKQNMRRAIMALEACKAHNYPFVEDQPIPIGWEEVLAELAAGILADPSTNRLFFVRGKLQTLLSDFVHPKLILLKLVEQFLKGVDASARRELYYWHAYYDKRLPPGTSALLKLEEFTAKFMSIHRRSFNHHQA